MFFPQYLFDFGGLLATSMIISHYNIRYVVDGEWLVDPSKQTVTDSKGNTNNVVVVEDRLAKCRRQVGGLHMKTLFR